MILPEHDRGIKVLDAWRWRNEREIRHGVPKDAHKGRFSGRFIRSTPLSWTVAAARLPGKSLHVGQALWYVAGLRKTNAVTLSSKVLQLFGVSRHAYSRCLAHMERAGLVRVERRAGKTPIVTILDA